MSKFNDQALLYRNAQSATGKQSGHRGFRFCTEVFTLRYIKASKYRGAKICTKNPDLIYLGFFPLILNGSAARKTIRPDDAATFSGSPSPVLVTGPLVLYRFLGTLVDTVTRKKSRNNPHGAFWFGQPVYDVLRDDFREATLSGERIKNAAQTILKGVREGLAVTYEWNTFDSIIQMTIPKRDTVAAWTGLTTWQLEWLLKPAGKRSQESLFNM